MTPQMFVDGIKTAVRDSAVNSTQSALQRPPGRRPATEALERSTWYLSLSEGDRKQVDAVVRYACHLTTYTFLCVLDGVKVLEDGIVKGDLELFYRRGDLVVRLNDPQGDELHDLFKAV